jgi:hypothetical protein
MLILPALLFLQAPMLSPPAPKPDAVPPARVEITTPFPIHLGSVGPREIREARFGLRSTHDRPFSFRVLDVSLGVSPDPATLAEPMQPGGTRTILIKVDPSGMEGYIKGAMRLGTDDPAQPNYILRFDMTVRPEVTVDSGRKSLGEVAPHERPEARFRFTREGGEPLKLALAGAAPAHLDAELLHEGATADLRLTLRPERLEPGTTAGLDVLKVATNGPKQPEFTLYLDWRIVTPVVATPSRLVFTELKTTLQGLELTARDGRPFRILKAEIQGKGFELLDGPGPEAVRHLLRVRRTGQSREGLLLIHCSNLDGPLNVPLRFLDPKARPPEDQLPPPPPVEEHGHRH